MNKNKLTYKQRNKITDSLISVAEAREDICSTVKRKCVYCPLNIEDKCSELNLSAFNFEINDWED